MSARARSMGQPALLIIIGVAIALRCISALVQGDEVTALPGIQDQISYDTLARQVLAGHGFTFAVDWWPATRAGEPTAHWSFLYTLYLTAVYAVAGEHPLVARLLQALVAGALYPLLVWRIGGRLFGNTTAFVAAGLVAVYGYLVYYGGALMTETFYILAILWAFDLAFGVAAARGRVAWRSWLLLGVALSAAVLLRQLVLLFVPFLFAWILWVRCAYPWRNVRATLAEVRPVLLGVGIALVVLTAAIAPWTIRNYAAFDRFVLLNTNAGFAFFWANHPVQGTNFVSIFPDEVYFQTIPPELLGLDEAALESALMQRSVGFVVADPGRYALLSISRIKDYFEFWPTAQSGTMSNLVRVLSFGLFLPLWLYGLAVSVARRRSIIVAGQGPALVLVCLFGLVYSLIHLLSWSLVRYRLPVDAAFMPLAALGVLDLSARIRAGSRLLELKMAARLPRRAPLAGSSTSSLGEPERL